MAATSMCLSSTCRQTVDGTVKQCPACGHRMLSSRQVRIGAGVMVFAGVVLIVLIGGVLQALVPSLLSAGEPDTSFRGTPGQARMILLLLGGVLAFGVGAAAGGLWQLVTGRSSLIVLWLVLGMAALVFGGTWLTISQL